MPLSSEVEVRPTPEGLGVFATRLFKAGTVVWRYSGTIQNEADDYTLQIDETHHLKVEENSVDMFFNHSCDPNVRVDFEDLTLIALSDITPGEEIVLNYLTAEWILVQPFICSCGAVDCVGRISGFSNLTLDQQARLEPLLSPFLLDRLKSRISGE